MERVRPALMPPNMPMTCPWIQWSAPSPKPLKAVSKGPCVPAGVAFHAVLRRIRICTAQELRASGFQFLRSTNSDSAQYSMASRSLVGS